MMDVLGDVNIVTIASACAIALALFLLPIWLERGTVSVLIPPIFGIATMTIGHAILDQLFEGTFWHIYAASGVAVIGGYSLTARRRKESDARQQPETRAGIADERKVIAFAAIVSVFVAYHFVVGGIPILSPDVEVARFNFTSSGLFGIPGRMYLFGLPFVVAYVSHAAERYPSERMRRLRTAMWVEFVAGQVLSGFKGGLVVVVLEWVMIRALLGRPIVVLGLLKPRFIALSLCAVMFGALMARRYETLDFGSGSPGVSTYLIERLTVIGAASGAYAIREVDGPAGGGLFLVDEFLYLAEKYFRLDLTNRDAYPLEKVVSAQMFGTSLDDDDFVVPVASGAFVTLAVDFGIPIALVLMLGVGMCYGALRVRATAEHDSFRFATLWLFAHGVSVFITNGSPAYLLLNSIVMTVMLSLVHWGAGVLVTREVPQ